MPSKTKPKNFEISAVAMGVLKWYEKAKNADSKRIEKLRKLYKIFINDLWADSERNNNDWLSQPKANFIINQVEMTVGMLTASDPEVHLEAVEPQDVEITDKFKGLVDYWWRTNNVKMKIIDAENNGTSYGTGLLELYFDPAANNWLGEIKTRNVAIEKFHPDPDAEDLDEMQYVLFEDWVSVAELQRTYNVKLDYMEDLREDFRQELQQQSGKLNHPISTVQVSGLPTDVKTVQWDPKYKRGDMSKVVEGKAHIIKCWWKDPTLEKIPQEDQVAEAEAENEFLKQGLDAEVEFNDNHKMHIESHTASAQQAQQAAEAGMLDPMMAQPIIQKHQEHIQKHAEFAELGLGAEAVRLKYPHGRFTIVTRDGWVVSDGDNPYKKVGFPFIPFYYIKRANEFWGMGIAELQEANQMAHNRVRAKQIDILNLVAAPPLLVPAASGLKINSPRLKPWEIWPINDIMQAPQLLDVSRAIPAIQHCEGVLQSIEQNMNTTVSIHDASYGQLPSSDTSGVAIQSLQGQAFQRVALPVKYMENGIKTLIKKVISMMQQFYTTPRSFRILGQDNQPLVISDFVASEYDDVELDIEITAGSTLPKNEIDQRTNLVELIKGLSSMGIMVPAEMIMESAGDIPNKQKYVQMIKAEQERIQMMNQQQQMVEQQSMIQQGQPNQQQPQGLSPEEQQILDSSTDPAEIEAILGKQ